METEMMEMQEILKAWLEKYQKLLQKLKVSQHKNRGYLEIDDRYQPPQYYHHWWNQETNQEHRRYLGKDQLNFAHRLAQQTYEKRVKILLRKRLKQWQAIHQDFCDNEIDAIYERMKPSRKALVKPIALTRTQKLQQWLEQPYEPFHFASDATTFRTKHGEMVRSKSEKILADLFYDKNIAYKYEAPLYIESRVFHPDFTFFDAYHEIELYWEHFGMMGDAAYLENALKKIRYYNTHGIIMGKNLIVTFESATCPLDFDEAETLVNVNLQYSSLC